jgi:predicted nucleotidyltransferase
MGVAALVERVEAVAGVTAVRLVGSRARGDPTPLSDWDYEVDTTDFDTVAAGLREAVAPLGPLADFWDPLGSRPNYIVVLDGPIKVDLIFAGHPFTPSAPWVPGPETLAAIDAHFWDWSLWLGAKQRRGEDELVQQQLVRQHEHLLGPMGVAVAPTSLAEAVEAYVEARDRQEQRFGVRVDRRLGRQVQEVLTART